jgi:hypothetical protein
VFINTMLCYRLVMSLNTIRSRCDWCVEHTAHTYQTGITIFGTRGIYSHKGEVLVVKMFNSVISFRSYCRNNIKEHKKPDVVIIYYMDKYLILKVVCSYLVDSKTIVPMVVLPGYAISRRPGYSVSNASRYLKTGGVHISHTPECYDYDYLIHFNYRLMWFHHKYILGKKHAGKIYR